MARWPGPGSVRVRAAGAGALFAALAFAAGLAGAGGPDDRAAAVRSVVAHACIVGHVAEAAAIGADLPGYRGLVGPPRAIDVTGWRIEFALDGATMAVSRFVPRGTLGRVTAELRTGADGPRAARPHLVAVADTTCRIHEARRLRYDSRGVPSVIEMLDENLAPTGRREPLDPPVPSAPDPGGVLVGLVDTGVNYLLPALAARLARSPGGGLLGYDYWDLDRRPFDADPVRSPLFPARHGTRTASLVARESAVARLVPYRYPRPDMGRMAALVDDAARRGVRVVNLSLASEDRARWRAYEAAVRRHPDILFVVAAGNRRRDIDRRPMYPAALDLANQLTVTAATGGGRIDGDANWGRRRVDLMAAADGLRATGFDGAERGVSGSSFAAARVTALAACLLAERPSFAAPALKALILARAVAAPDSHRVAHGFLPDPTTGRRGACAAGGLEPGGAGPYTTAR